MVRFLLSGGKKIQLLPPPDPETEEMQCDKCHKDFDTGLNRRACFQLCRHISCLSCILKLTAGCLQCPSPRERAILRKVVVPGRKQQMRNGIRRERPLKQKGHVETQMPQVMVLSSVLSKNSEDDDEDTFPEIKRLSLSALPVLGCPTEPPKHLQEEEEDEEEEEEDEFIEDENPDIPLIELSDDEENIPVIELSSDDEEEKNEVFPDSNNLVSQPLRLPILQNVLAAAEIVPPEIQTPPTQPSSPVTPTSDFPDEMVPSIIIPTSGGTSTKRGPKSRKQVSEQNSQGNENKLESLLSESEENQPPRSLRQRRKSHCYSSDYWDGTGIGNHICKYCGSGFVDRKVLGLHLFQEHWDIRRFPCEVCNWPFDTQRNLEIHMLTHTNERPFKCSICEKGFNRNYTLSKHMEKIHGVMLEKKRRGKNKPRPKSQKKDRLLSVASRKRSTKKDGRSSTRKESAKGTPTKRNQPLEEIFDEVTTSEPTPIPVHLTLNSDEDLSNDDFATLETPHQQMEMDKDQENILEPFENDKEDPDYVVSIQSYTSDLPPKKRLHMRNCRQMSPKPAHSSSPKVKQFKSATATSNRKYTCSHCHQKFPGKMKLGNHLREKHADMRPHACDLCGWSFAQKNKLDLHRITHTIDRPHKCKHCESTFNRKYSLERHVRIMHLKKPRKSEAAENKPCQRKRANCPYCHKMFETRHVLGVHMIEKHDDRRPHICAECQWPFARKKHLVAHMKTHSKEKPWQCTMCDGKFNRRFSLERHMDTVHRIRIRLTPQEENPMDDIENYCPECQSRFDTGKYAKVAYSECGHYSCMDCVIKAELGCGQCTTENAPREWTLEEGAKSPLKILQDAPAKVFQQQVDVQEKVVEECTSRPKSVIVENPNKLNGVKNGNTVEKKRTYKCTYCKKPFAEKAECGIHMQHLHSDIRPYFCDVCQWTFSSTRDLERHKIIHTNERPYKCQMCSVAFNRKSTRDRHVEKIHLKWRRI